ncbi:MAG: 6-phosphogluconolactonase [Mariprofundaceae bacterium]|nr:6-phosphogluconolactonase [Mariprofundaceae bacterium]
MRQTEFSSLENMSQALCAVVIQNLRNAIDEKGMASLVLSGGRTPETYLPILFAAPLTWTKVNITLSDERWVPPNHPDSNEGLVRRFMPPSVAKKVSFTSLWVDDMSLSDAEYEVEKRLSEISQPFDCAILGMGEDGHFASLFPATQSALSQKRQCLAVENTPSYPRMSLSPNRLISTRNIHLCVTGAKKMDVLEQAKKSGDPDELPIRILLTSPTIDNLLVYAMK